jgi:hypothetical protein
VIVPMQVKHCQQPAEWATGVFVGMGASAVPGV